MIVYDDLGNRSVFHEAPTRIVSLVPSLTELVADLGCQESLVGVTKFCVHPPEIRKSAVVIGGTKSVRIDQVKSLRPDLIIANKEENVKEQITSLQATCTVFVTDIPTLSASYQTIEQFGNILDQQAHANHVITSIQSGVSHIFDSSKRVLYLIWRNPYMSVGRDTYISDVLQQIGLTNLTGDKTRYPELNDEQIKLLDPELVFLSSEPYPFKEKHFREIQNLLPDAKIILVDGEAFSWYGSRLMHLHDYFPKLAHRL